MRTFISLMQREWWENQSAFMRVPAIVGMILVLAAILAFIAYGIGVHINAIDTSQFNQQASSVVIHMLFYMSGIPFIFVLWLLIASYSLSCLYDDRRDKSILFWNSLPISQTETVLSKVVTALIVAPICTLICMIITQLILLIVGTIILLIIGLNFWTVFWHPGVIISTWFSQLAALCEQMLWLLPWFAWFMLCSAYAKKAPFIRAIVPIIIILLIELFFSQHHYFAHFAFGNIAHAMGAWKVGDVYNKQAMLVESQIPFTLAKNYIYMYIGWLVSAICIIGAIATRFRTET